MFGGISCTDTDSWRIAAIFIGIVYQVKNTVIFELWNLRNFHLILSLVKPPSTKNEKYLLVSVAVAVIHILPFDAAKFEKVVSEDYKSAAEIVVGVFGKGGTKTNGFIDNIYDLNVLKQTR